jgi:hypothetical protein
VDLGPLYFTLPRRPPRRPASASTTRPRRRSAGRPPRTRRPSRPAPPARRARAGCRPRSAHHYNSYSHFRRPEAAENRPVPAENKLFSTAKDLFSAASGRQKKLAKNKALLSAARPWPPKIAYFRRLASWPPKVSYFWRPGIQPPKIKTVENKTLIFGGQGADENY